MMHYGYEYGGMMGFGGGSSLICGLICLVVLVDLILLGVWLWKKIGEKPAVSEKTVVIDKKE